METGRAVAPRRQILSATGGVGYDWSSPAQTSLRVYNSSVAKVQVICWATRSNRLIEAVGIDSQFGDPFAQGIAIDPQYVRRAQLIPARLRQRMLRSEEHTSELQSLMRISYAVFCLQKQ